MSLQSWCGLHALKQLLLELLKISPAVRRGGPGGMPVGVNGELWNIGLSPGGHYFISNGGSGQEVARYYGYRLTTEGDLSCNDVATYDPTAGGHYVDSSVSHSVTRVDEITWLIELVIASAHAEWGGDVRIRPRPMPSSEMEIPRFLLRCGCWVGLIVQQENGCRHNSGRYPHNELDLEAVACGCDQDLHCDRCRGHRYIYVRRLHT